MFRLALHWQILIGMIAGSILGILLSAMASQKTTTLMDGLPDGIVKVVIEDTAEKSTIRYTHADGSVQQRVVSALPSDETEFANLDSLRKADPMAAGWFESQGRSVARRVGLWMKRLGDLFLRMLKMVAVPLIVTSLLSGVLNLGNGAGVGRMFRRTLTYYMATSFLAIVTGLLVVNLIRPGLQNGQAAVAAVAAESHAAKPLGEVLFEQVEAMIPANTIGAFAEPNFLSIIAFTIAFALFSLKAGNAVASSVTRAANVGFSVMMSMTTAIIHLAPIGVFFLMAAVTATQGPGVFAALAYYVLAVAVALAIHGFVTLPIILWVFAKRNPIEYFKAMSPALLTAFSSASSNGTLPLTMTSVEQRAGVSNKTGSFVLPLGATINMDGTALYEVVAVLFIAQMHFGVNLPIGQQVIVALTALLASVGAAGIPHAGLVMMAIILQAVGLPAEMQGIILAVDRVLDMARTTVNVWSDSCGCAVVDRLEGLQKPTDGGNPDPGASLLSSEAYL